MSTLSAESAAGLEEMGVQEGKHADPENEWTNSETFRLHQGDGPVLFSVPHAGTECPDWLALRLTESARLFPDTDWFVDRLYGFAPGRGQSMLVARHTRYLVDLNRPASDESLYPGQTTTGLCATEQFDGQPVYQDGEQPEAREIAERVEQYWRPYHQQLFAELERIKARHGYAILFDCHSIDSVLPRLFEGELPFLNLGTNHGATAAPSLQSDVVSVLEASGLSLAVNGRFVGGEITRSLGRPAEGVHALQLELGWRGYLSVKHLAIGHLGSHLVGAKAPTAHQGAPIAQWNPETADRLTGVLEGVAGALETWRPAV